MTAAQRRQAILAALQGADAPLTATLLAGQLSVSRQIIVGDVALLRASGADITATPRGYMMGHAGGKQYTVVCCHDSESMGRELELMVDHGCIVENVAVEHSVYGLLVGHLELHSRYDVAEFLRKVSESDAQPLAALTNGIHTHTLRCPDEGAYLALLDALRAGGFLVESEKD